MTRQKCADIRHVEKFFLICDTFTKMSVLFGLEEMKEKYPTSRCSHIFIFQLN